LGLTFYSNSEKNDPDLRKGILGKSLTQFLLFLFQFYWENGCITQELILITFQFSNFHIHFLSHRKIIPPNKLVHFILIDWLDQDDMLTAKKALTNRRKEQCSIHQQNEQLPKKGLKPLDVKMIV
jgi:hypothetical protein